MEPAESRRVEIVLPMRTVVVVAAAIGLMVAFAAIGDTFLIVFVGIFLAFVFEYPVRFVMERTRMSRGLAATVTVLGAALVVGGLLLLLLVPLVGSVRDFLQDLPEVVAELRASDELSSWLGDSGAAGNVQDGADRVSGSIPDAISAVLGIAGGFFTVFIAGFTILFTCLFLLTDVGNLKRSLTSVLMPGDDKRWLTVWERVTETISRWAIGVIVIATIAGTIQGTTAWILGSSYAVALGVIAGLLDMIPNIGATIAGFILVPTLWAEEGLTAAIIMLIVVLALPAAREQRAHAEDPGQGRPALGVLHHRLGHAVRRAPRRPRRADRGAARRDDPDLRPGAHEGAPRAGRRCEGGTRGGVGTIRPWPNPSGTIHGRHASSRLRGGSASSSAARRSWIRRVPSACWRRAIRRSTT